MRRRAEPWDETLLPEQAGRVIVVTGASAGLGLRIAEVLAARGAQVVMACRTESKAQAAHAAVRSAATGEQPELVRLDLADLSSVRTAAEQIAGAVEKIDVLINNAGVMFAPPGRTADGFERHFGTNHLGHFALTGLLIDRLLQAPAPRVVTVSSVAARVGAIRWQDPNRVHSRRSRPWTLYAQSKLANLLFAFELDRIARAGGSSLVSLAAHPGMSGHTDLLRDTSAAVAFGLRAISIGVTHEIPSAALSPLYASVMHGVHGGEYYGPDGPLQGRGLPHKTRARRIARDPVSGRRLWQLSEELTGVVYPSLAPNPDPVPASS
ncbi:MAG: oxidoreductase [Solirubrobacteraceae bacterium]